MDKFRSLITYAVLLIFGLTMVVPFIWMLSTSLMTQSEFNKQETLFIPKQEYHIWNQGGETKRILLVMEKGDNSIIHVLDDKLNIVEEYKEVPSSQIELVRKKPSLQFSNYIKAFKKVPFGLYFANTLYVSFTSLIGVLITSMLAAYAFARMEFRGRDFLFYLFLSMMMVPQPIYMISSYILLDKLNWLDTYNALIVPWIANIFTIFLFR
ncbi:MAG TPA: carbohydrate ABC transporter permease, partial [Candidatus Cloacimonadota bacterium]|nr:carbohydrate ABC transporter permease [Candidatus Cloacimonadota bacterium]